MNYILYGTSACHLSEAAETIILPIQQSLGFRLQKVDIAEDDTLIAQYGTKIPVLYCKQTKQALEWPFDSSQLNHFLEARNKTSTQ